MTPTPPPIPVRGRASLNVIETEPARRGPDRALDRRITYAGLVISALFLVAAGLSLGLPPGVRFGWWLPLHLALAGAAATAVAAMLPFFVAALAVAPPAPGWLHGGAIALVGAGATLAALGRAAGVPAPVPALGAATFIAGAAAVGVSALAPLRRATGSRRPATEAAYIAGLGCVIAGVSLGGLYFAGEPTVLAAWSRLRAAHAWLNVFGFLGLVISGTLLHLAPTVAGARIRSRTSGRVAVAALGSGAAVGAVGYVLDAGGLVVGGAALLVAAAAALTWHGLRVQRDAVGWSSEHDWHSLASWSLLAAPAWLLVAAVLVAVRVAGAGAGGQGWPLQEVAGPLVGGFAIQVLLGALAHLVPAVAPSGPADRAAARRMLGRLGMARVIAWNVGVATLTVGVLGAAPEAALPALVTLVMLTAASLATVLLTVLSGVRRKGG